MLRPSTVQWTTNPSQTATHEELYHLHCKLACFTLYMILSPQKLADSETPMGNSLGGHLKVSNSVSTESWLCHPLPLVVVWDCAIDLLTTNADPPRSKVYLLPDLAFQAIEDYIVEALAYGLICLSTSPASAGFSFVQKGYILKQKSKSVMPPAPCPWMLHQSPGHKDGPNQGYSCPWMAQYHDHQVAMMFPGFC